MNKTIICFAFHIVLDAKSLLPFFKVSMELSFLFLPRDLALERKPCHMCSGFSYKRLIFYDKKRHKIVLLYNNV